MEEVIAINDVLSAGMFDAIQNTAKTSWYEPLERGDDTSIYVAPCSKFLSAPLLLALEEKLGKFEVITDYFRLNTQDIDTHTRIHSDGLILGKQPDYGVVYYINSKEGTGTGFWSHSKYGDRLPEGIVQPETEYGDESLWTFNDFVEGKMNSMVAYPANLFHQRYPTKPDFDRMVWVCFLRRLT